VYDCNRKMKKYKNIFVLLISVLLISGLRVSAQTPQDSAAERARTQKTDPNTDQASPGATQGTRAMLQDTGGKSGVSGQEKKNDTARNGQESNTRSYDYYRQDKYVMWGIIILVLLVTVALIRRYNRER